MNNDLKFLKNNDFFCQSFKKLVVNENIDANTTEFLLGCAYLFIKEFSKDNRLTIFFEIAYFISLKIAILKKDYNSLLDISSNLGLYPISKHIIDKDLLNNKDNEIDSENTFVNLFSLNYQLKKFRHNEITETLEQKKFREKILANDSKENSYIAPTSYGKSSLILEIIKKNIDKKIAIIVPTKSLLVQTVKLVNTTFKNHKIIFHDEMYDNQEFFIAVLTQERGLRLLKNENLSFDILIIDEAHNIFENDQRSILLTRLIRKNNLRNKYSRLLYLSPLINDSNNLKITSEQHILENKIVHNIKIPDIYEYCNDGSTRKYDRFLNKFYPISPPILGESYLHYIFHKKLTKNFLYINSPKKIEEFSKIFSQLLPNKNNKNLNEISLVISKYVHKDFYCVDYIKKGISYIHGKLPDLIKEYLEYKFSKLKEFEYIVANKVILEGINLPIDNLFILSVNSLDKQQLINLIGRVNRLNEVFNEHYLHKLIPQIHFLNNDKFNRKNGKMENKIKLLKKTELEDIVKNPILLNFNEKNLSSTKDSIENEEVDDEQSSYEKIENIKKQENFIINNDTNPQYKTKKYLIESGVLSVYLEYMDVTENLEKRIEFYKNTPEWKSANPIEKIFILFIRDLEIYITNFEFSRLKNQEARTFYINFVKRMHTMSLKEHILFTVNYMKFKKKADPLFYIGASYGEESKMNPITQKKGSKVYIDVSKKTDKELVNIALVKIKIESDFLSYRINEYVNLLYSLNLLSEKEYNLFIYGSEIKAETALAKIGLSSSLINQLSKDEQLSNVHVTEFGRLDYNKAFQEYLSKQDDLINFEISKYADIHN